MNENIVSKFLSDNNIQLNTIYRINDLEYEIITNFELKCQVNTFNLFCSGFIIYRNFL